VIASHQRCIGDYAAKSATAGAWKATAAAAAMLAPALLFFVTVGASAASTDDGPTTATSQLKPAAMAEAAGSRKQPRSCF